MGHFVDPTSADPRSTALTEGSSDDPKPAAAADGLAVVLQCARLDEGGPLVPLAGVSRVVIGRGERCATHNGASAGEIGLHLSDGRVSGSHAAIHRAPEGYVLEDLGSSNGTFVGPLRIERHELRPGELFRVGHTLLCVLEDAGPAIARSGASIEPWPFPTLSGPFARNLSRLERIAASDVPLLLLGDTGTGKEVLARAVHSRSGRPGQLVAVNCGALPASLVEAQMFGHTKGAFSGAARDEPGFVRAADGGTLFLDEVGELAPSAQSSLLRVLQEGEVTPVGAVRPLRVDVRVVAATNRPLADMVDAGTFRADLLARLAGFTFQLPSLRERREDIGHLLASFTRSAPASIRLRPDAALAMLAYDWPLNIRELKRTFETSALLAEEGVIRLSDLPENVRGERVERRSTRPPLPALSPKDGALRAELAQRLEASGNNVSQVAREMGKARQQIQRWVRRFGLGKG